LATFLESTVPGVFAANPDLKPAFIVDKAVAMWEDPGNPAEGWVITKKRGRGRPKGEVRHDDVVSNRKRNKMTGRYT
jgi:hypothetical protein